MKKNWEQIGLQAFWRLNSARPSHCSHSSYCESARRSEPVARLPVPWASPDGPRPRIFPYERDAEVVPCAASADKNSASRSRLVSHPRHVFMHQSGAAKPTCSKVRRVPPSIRSSRNVTIVGLLGVPPECHVSTSFFEVSISKNSPSSVKGRPLPVPTATPYPYVTGPIGRIEDARSDPPILDFF
jgi:hypothetical protein